MSFKRFEKERDFETLRKLMVDEQIVRRGVKDKRVIRAMLKVPRHLFVPEEFIEEAYNDYPLPIGEGQTISQPYMVAIMTEALELTEKDRVLEIGTGSGYQTAILAEIAREVFTIEYEPKLAYKAFIRLKAMKYDNFHLKVGNGSLGWKEFAPFEKILVTAAAPEIPPPYKEQLADGGVIVIPVGHRFAQVLIKARKDGEVFEKEEILDCAFVPLRGKYGFSLNYP